VQSISQITLKSFETHHPQNTTITIIISGLNITTFKEDKETKAADPSGMARFTIKIAALILSRFQEV